MGLINLFVDTLNPEKSILSIGPKFIPMNWIINAQKGGTIFMMYFLMWYYQNFSIGSYIYLSLHGSYGNLILY